MPVGFLTDEQRRRYGHFHRTPTPEECTRYFHLDDTDRNLIAAHRGDHNRLGFAVQLCTVRFLGTFLDDLSEVPSSVVLLLAQQLSIEKSDCITSYCSSRQRWDHTAEIRRHGGYTDYSDPIKQFRLNRWLYALSWTGTDRPGALFDRATIWLITHKVLLPGVTVLERQVARIRSRVQERIWNSLVHRLSPEARARLDALLITPDGGHQSLLDRLRKGPFRRSAPELVRALRRIDEVRALEVNVAVTSHVPPGRIQALARFATTSKASALVRLPPERRLATLVAFVLTLEAAATDDALDLVDILITDIFSDATKAGEQARLRTIKDLDAAATRLAQVCQLVLDENVPDAQLRAAIWNTMKSEELTAALAQVEMLVRPPVDMYYQELQQSWRRVRRFLPPLLQTIQFGSTPAGRALDEALKELSAQAGAPLTGQEHLEIVSTGWRRYVVDEDGAIDQKAYVFCCPPSLCLQHRVRAAGR